MRSIGPTHSSRSAPPAVGRPANAAFPQMHRLLDPLRLRLVLAVERHGSISAAAEACAVGQPTASSHLRTLESALGERLYERAGRGTRLTDAGKVLARHAEAVMSTLEALEQELSALRGAHAGTLRVACCDAFGSYLFPVALAQFAAERPNVDVHAHICPSGEVIGAVARGDAHLGIAGEGRRLAGVVSLPLLGDELVGIAPGEQGWPRGRVDPAVLGRFGLVVSSPQSSTRALTERLLGRLGCRPSRIVELDSLEALKRGVRSRLGVAFVSALAMAEEGARSGLTTFELECVAPLGHRPELVRSPNRPATPLDAAFERTLRDLCAEPAAPCRTALG